MLAFFSIPWWYPFFLASTAMAAYTDLSTDASGLLAFKSRLLDDSSLNWYDNSASLVCNWTGVKCGSRHRRVTALDLSEMGLAGSLPPEIGNLTFLVSLNLTNNRFHGNLPYELTRLRRLRSVDFSVNGFSGELPSSIGLLNELRTLRIHNNSFRGSIPQSLANATRLERIVLMFNEFGGEIPPPIFNLSNLVLLNLLRNNFSGRIPSRICSGMPKIRFLVLRGNQLEGEIPSNLAECSELQLLSLAENQLIGPIPEDMSSDSSQLRMIYLYNNRLVGRIPENIGECRELEVLDIHGNNLTGTIPFGMNNLTNLQVLDLSSNQFTGVIPNELGVLRSLEYVSLGNNFLAGGIPYDMFNISTLQSFSVARNNLTGKLPLDFCYGIPNLEELFLDRNAFFGEIPQSISNCTNLRFINIGVNGFGGIIPDGFGDMSLLERLFLAQNDFICGSEQCGFFAALTNCRYLDLLELSYNPLGASLPKTIGNLSTSLEYFRCYHCGLVGTVPMEFGNLTQMLELNLGNNNLMGMIPRTFEKLVNLQGFFLDFNNNISGVIPEFLCGLHHLSVIYLDMNQLSGVIPTCIGNLTSLRRFSFGGNRLESTIPSSLWQLNNVIELNLSSNFLSGSIPSDIGNWDGVYLADLSENGFSGAIPSSIGDMQALTYLSLAFNEFAGRIPESVGRLVSLQHVDLSHNRLSGNIPEDFRGITSLVYFDVSFNNLSGPIPSGGPFRNFSSVNFESNEGLCGESRFGVPSCEVPNDRPRRRSRILLVAFVLVGVFGGCFVLILVYKLCLRFRRHDGAETEESRLSAFVPIRVSYHDIVQATEDFHNDHLLGIGTFGAVYKGILRNGMTVAIKAFNLQIDQTYRSFDVECQVFRQLRHRNLCKVISVCSNDDFKALVMEHMPNGSLEKWLHGENQFLNMAQILSIMIDIASALEYLHEGYTAPIVHCDVKPSNILLDNDMVAHLSDFGIAKLSGDMEGVVQTMSFATAGYIAPEYGSQGLVSTRCDVYSFGIVLMEAVTGKSPNDDEFAGDLTLRSLVRDSISNDISCVVDSRLLNPDEENNISRLECVSSVFELALKCSREDPNERISMKDAVINLKAIFSSML